LVLSPQKLIGHLGLAPDSRVLELGPGPGFFSIDVARAVPRGRLELVDVQYPMLQKARRRLGRAGARNAGFTQADAARLPFRQSAFDAAFLVAVLGEVHDPKACLVSISEALRPEGALSVAELLGDPDALSLAQVRRLAEESGFVFTDSLRLRAAFIATFRRARS
jgi:ubiquinone/menaquinone biosynthesis C-methylase UbiE